MLWFLSENYSHILCFDKFCGRNAVLCRQPGIPQTHHSDSGIVCDPGPVAAQNPLCQDFGILI